MSKYCIYYHNTIGGRKGWLVLLTKWHLLPNARSNKVLLYNIRSLLLILYPWDRMGWRGGGGREGGREEKGRVGQKRETLVLRVSTGAKLRNQGRYEVVKESS